jgi:hypothetical protein
MIKKRVKNGVHPEKKEKEPSKTSGRNGFRKFASVKELLEKLQGGC